MCRNHLEVSLGFTDDKVPSGTHMCLIYTDEEERREALLKFLQSGIENGERTACFSEKTDETTVREFLLDKGIPYSDHKQRKAISLHGTREVYFEGGVFDPDKMLNNLKSFYRDSMDMGFTAARVIGEMIPEVQDVPGGERLLEYESRVTMMLRDEPVTSVCQYDANAFDGATILEVLKVHPQMIVNGAVVNNPFYIKPEIYLNKHTQNE